MNTLEGVALTIVALFVFGRARLGDPRGFLVRLGLLVIASWIAEDTSIRAYGFYAYDARWSLFVDKVPLAIALIWPVVIHSAWDLARHLSGKGQSKVVWVGSALVLADASLIEPVSVASGLWRWTEPGLFNVPPIGILGWVFHAGLCMAVLERAKGRVKQEALTLLTPFGTHALLLGGWWGCLRWMNAAVPPNVAIGVVWILSVVLTYASRRSSARHRVKLAEFLLRVPAATFFFVLLAIYGHSQPQLVAWTLAFVPPYCSLMDLRRAATNAAS